jgi:adenylate kinase
MSKPIITIHNTETDEIIEREMTDSEYQQHLKDVATFEAEQAERQAKTQAKAQLLAQLGITEEQAKLLLS